MKKLVAIILIFALLCPFPSARAQSTVTTIMMYMCGSNLQSDCIEDLREMCRAKASDNVNIVVLCGGASEWDDRRLKANRLNLFSIENNDFSQITDWGKGSMGNPGTLEKFVNYAQKSYPADRYCLFLWNHGGGSADGVCFDECYSDDSLTMREINTALYNLYNTNKNFHLAMLGCDACLMGSYEMAVLASMYADYYIASEELEPWTGWYYTPWINALAKNPGMSTEEIGRNMVDAYKLGVEEENAEEYTTLSLIDCAAMSALSKDMEQLAVYMEQALENGQLATIRRALSRMYRYGTFDSADGTWDMHDMGDILDLCAQFAPNAAGTAKQHLAQAVAYAYASDDMPVASGMSIYVPNKSAAYFEDYVLEGYDMSCYIPNYVDFVYGMSYLMSGSNYSFQASCPSAADMSSASASPFSFGSSFFGYVPGSTYNAETSAQTAAPVTVPSGPSGNTATSFTPNFSTNPSSSGGTSFGSNFGGGSSVSGGTDFSSGFTTGSASQAAAAAPALNADASVAFSLSLSQEALQYLDYAEGSLYMDISDEDGVSLLELGYLRNSWVDWENGVVYSAFDGFWPTLDGQFVVMYDQSKNAVSRRSLIPVTVNGEETYLVVSFTGDDMVGEVLGYNDGVDSNGLPIRRIHSLKNGDVIVPLYTMLYCDWDDLENDEDMSEYQFEGDPIIWDNSLEVFYQDLADEDDPTDYQFAFYLNDIFGDYELSDFFSFTM